MATYSTTQQNPSAVSAGESVTITGGVTTIGGTTSGEITSANAWSANGLGVVTVSSGGALHIKNTTTDGLTVLFNTTIALNLGGYLAGTKIEGGWKSIGTGDGTASQTVTNWHTYYQPCVWVETGNGTGVYEKYLNLNHHKSADNKTFSTVGAGDIGRFFTQTRGNATITFGDGTNGKKPPNGADIKVPNIVVATNADTSVASTMYNVPSISGRPVAVEKATFEFSKGISTSSSTSATANGCCFTDSDNTYNLTMTDCGISTPRTASFTNNRNWIRNNFHLDNCAYLIREADPFLRLQTAVDSSVKNSQIYQVDNTSTTSSSGWIIGEGASAVEGQTIDIEDNLIVGTIYLIGSGNFTGNTLYNHILGSQPANAHNHIAFNFWSGSISNNTVPSGFGSSSYNFLHIYGSWLNPEFNNNTHNGSCSRFLFFASGTTSEGMNVIGNHIETPGTNSLTLISTGLQGTSIVQNNTAGTYTNADIGGVPPATIPKMCASSSSFDGFSGTDLIFYQMVDGASSGILIFKRNTYDVYSDYITTLGTGTAYGANWSGSNSSNCVIAEMPFQILGVTAFDNADVYVSSKSDGKSTTYYTGQYSLDTGSGWGAWKDTTGTNLSGETLPDKTVGFKMRIKLYEGTAGATINSAVKFNCTVDTSVTYPASFVDIALSNVVSGSRYYVYRTSSGELISSGTASGSTVTISDVEYSGTENITIRIRKSSGSPKYKPFETQASLTANGANVYVSQALDNIAN